MPHFAPYFPSFAPYWGGQGPLGPFLCCAYAGIGQHAADSHPQPTMDENTKRQKPLKNSLFQKASIHSENFVTVELGDAKGLKGLKN